MTQFRAAILGTGHIGTDLLFKVRRSALLCCTSFVGRRDDSCGMQCAKDLGIAVSTQGLNYLLNHSNTYDVVFDATSAAGHRAHAPCLAKINKPVIDLTPAKVGDMCVPAVDIEPASKSLNLNTITCGGQATVPLAWAIGRTQANIRYLEVVSHIASASAGPATRANLDEYIETTELALQKFSGVQRCKAILNLNPAEPCITMQATVMADIDAPNLSSLRPVLSDVIDAVRQYVPGYSLCIGPMVEHGRLIVSARVTGAGDHLPVYAGNLDIITCAAVAIAEAMARMRRPS